MVVVGVLDDVDGTVASRHDCRSFTRCNCNGMLGSLEEDDENKKKKKKEREEEAVLDTCNSAIRQTRQLES